MSVGIAGRHGIRNVPTLVNRAYGRAFFWDGRATSLEAQVLRPIQDTLEMGLPLPEAVARLRSDARYRGAFNRVFAEPPSAAALSAALASYVRTVLSGNSPFDRWTRGDTSALTPEQRAGLALFRAKANCGSCHIAPTFTDEQFHNTGVAWRDGMVRDSGRYMVTRHDADLGAFKTPTLRELPRTAPYMHDGSLPTVDEVIEFYDRGGNPNPYLDRGIRPLHLAAEEKRALIAYLRALRGEVQEGVPRRGMPASGSSTRIAPPSRPPLQP